MITCKTCNNPLVETEAKYWKLLKNGDKHYYCDANCSLIDHNKEKAKK